MKLKAMVSRHFAHWVASYENDLYTEDNFIDIYTLRTIHLLTILSKYRILELTRYAIGGLEFNIDKKIFMTIIFGKIIFAKLAAITVF